MKNPTIQYDPHRLDALDAKRRAARALQREASDRYSTLRDRREDAQKRLGNLRYKAEQGDGSSRHEALAQVEELMGDVAKLSAQMSQVQSEISHLSSSAGRAGTLFKRALDFAVEEGLEIPDQFATEAENRGALA